MVTKDEGVLLYDAIEKKTEMKFLTSQVPILTKFEDFQDRQNCRDPPNVESITPIRVQDIKIG